jgi:hypothetical protein
MRDRDRERLVREGVEQVRRIEFDAYKPLDDTFPQCESLAEILAVVVAEARAKGADETLWAEVLLRAVDYDRETLVETRATMAALGYTVLAEVLKRLARTAPRKLTWHERMRASRERWEAEKGH